MFMYSSAMMFEPYGIGKILDLLSNVDSEAPHFPMMGKCGVTVDSEELCSATIDQM